MKSRGGPLLAPIHLLFALFSLTLVAGVPFSTLDDKVILIQTNQLGGVASAKDPLWAEGPFGCDTVVQRKCSSLASQATGCGASPMPSSDTFNRTLRYYTCASPPAPASGSSSGGGGGGGSGGSGGADALLRESWRGGVGRRPAAPAPSGQRQPRRASGVWDLPPELPLGGQQGLAPAQPQQLPDAAPQCADSAAAPLVCLETAPQVPPVGRAPVRVELGRRLASSAPAGSRCTCFLRHNTQAGGSGLAGGAPGLEASAPYSAAHPQADWDALYGHARQAPR